MAPNARFQPGDKVLAPHPLDAFSGVKYTGTVTASRRVDVAGEDHEVVTIDYGGGHTAEIDAAGVEAQ